MYPLSNCMPSTNSSSIPKVWDSSTVMTPSLPTFSNASAIVSPMARSPAEIVATWAISSLPSTSRACLPRCSTAAATPFSMPRLRPIGFAPAATFLIPSRTMARARTVAVVVPSPATSLVLVATSRASCAPMFSQGSSSSISLAMVTPSLVMVGAPHFLSRTTLRPFGPSVIDTASASLFTPASRARRASSSNFSILAATWSAPPVHNTWVHESGTPAGDDAACGPRLEGRLPALLPDDGQHVAGRQDEVLLVLELARTDGDDLALLGLLLSGVGDHDARDRGLLLLAGLDHDAVVQRFQVELRHLHPPRSDSCGLIASTLSLRVLRIAERGPNGQREGTVASTALTVSRAAEAGRGRDARRMAHHVAPEARITAPPPMARAARGSRVSARNPATGAPMGVVPRNTTPNRAMTRPRMAGVAWSWSSGLDDEMNTVLAIPQGIIASRAPRRFGMTARRTSVTPNAAAPATSVRSPTRPRNAMASPPLTAPTPTTENRAPYPQGPACNEPVANSGRRVEKLKPSAPTTSISSSGRRSS